MMFDVVTVGSATQDVFLIQKDAHIVSSKKFATGKAECFALGVKVELDGIVFDTGGGATNAAVSLRRAGLRVATVTRIGYDPAGAEVERVLKQERIAPQFIVHDREHCTAYSSILLTPEGERTILVYRGASSHFHWEEFPHRRAQTRWVYLTSLGGDQRTVDCLAQWAYTNGVKVFWNPGAAELAWGWDAIEEYGRFIEILMVNREEASQLAKKLFDNIEGTYLTLRRSKYPMIIMTDGGRGASMWPFQGRYHVESTGQTPVNTTGAGDAFGAAFLAGLIKWKGDIPQAARLAAYNSGSVISHMGAKHGIMRRVPAVSTFKKIKVTEE